MTKPQSSIHAPTDNANPSASPPASPPPTPPRIARLSALDRRPLVSRSHTLGPGGASALFTRAIELALVEEMVEQLRAGPFEVAELEDGSGVRRWALDIVSAFLEED